MIQINEKADIYGQQSIVEGSEKSSPGGNEVELPISADDDDETDRNHLQS